MRKPKLLDICCGGGGAGVGYYRAGFDVVGVDLRPQPNYPFEFHQADAVEFLQKADLSQFDVIHASPPCQRYSVATNIRPGSFERHPDLVAPIRELLKVSGKPFVIENVPKAPIRADIVLYGWMFGLPVIRRRHFEIEGFFLLQPSALKPKGTAHGGDFVTVAGQGCSYNTKTGHNGAEAARTRKIKCWKGNVVETWKHAMGIDWMKTRKELAESIPPTYTEYIGRQIIDQMKPQLTAYRIPNEPDYQLRIGSNEVSFEGLVNIKPRYSGHALITNDRYYSEKYTEQIDPAPLVALLQSIIPADIAAQVWPSLPAAMMPDLPVKAFVAAHQFLMFYRLDIAGQTFEWSKKPNEAPKIEFLSVQPEAKPFDWHPTDPAPLLEAFRSMFPFVPVNTPALPKQAPASPIPSAKGYKAEVVYRNFYRLDIGGKCYEWNNAVGSPINQFDYVNEGPPSPHKWQPIDPAPLMEALQAFFPFSSAIAAPPAVQSSRTCEHCRKSFKPGNRRARFCGTACRVAAHRSKVDPTSSK